MESQRIVEEFRPLAATRNVAIETTIDPSATVTLKLPIGLPRTG